MDNLWGDVTTEGKTLAEALDALGEMEVKLSTVRTPEGSKKQGQPVGSQFGRDSGMTVGKGKTLDEAARRVVRAVQRQRVPASKDKVEFVPPSETVNGTAQVRFRGKVEKNGNTFYALYDEHGDGYIGNDRDGKWFYSYGDTQDWAVDRHEAASTVAALSLAGQVQTAGEKAIPKPETKAGSQEDDLDGMDDGAQRTYHKLRKRGVAHAVAVVMAKHSKK